MEAGEQVRGFSNYALCFLTPGTYFQPQRYQYFQNTRDEHCFAFYATRAFPHLRTLRAQVALCVMLDRIISADARLRPSRGLPPRRKNDQIRILLAGGTNVAVDRQVGSSSEFQLVSAQRGCRGSSGVVEGVFSVHDKLLKSAFSGSCGRIQTVASYLQVKAVLFGKQNRFFIFAANPVSVCMLYKHVDNFHFHYTVGGPERTRCPRSFLPHEPGPA